MWEKIVVREKIYSAPNDLIYPENQQNVDILLYPSLCLAGWSPSIILTTFKPSLNGIKNIRDIKNIIFLKYLNRNPKQWMPLFHACTWLKFTSKKSWNCLRNYFVCSLRIYEIELWSNSFLSLIDATLSGGDFFLLSFNYVGNNLINIDYKNLPFP